MPLKFQMDSVEGMDPAVAGLYTKQETTGKFVLTGIENVVHKSKIDEFRNNNIELTNKLATFEGIDPVKVKADTTSLAEALIKLEQKGDIDEETVNKLVEARVKNINDDSATKILGYETTISTQAAQLETLILDGDVNKAAVTHKIDPAAYTDVQLRTRSTFKIVDGVAVAMDGEGQKMYGDDGVTPLSIDGFVKGLLKTSPHLFQPSVTSHLKNNDGNGFTGDASKLSALQKIQHGLGGAK